MTARLTAVLFLILVGHAAAAATRTWTGAVDDRWSTAANWSPAGVPVSGDALVFPSGGTVLNTVNDLPGAPVFTTISINDAYRISGNTVRVSSAITSPSCLGRFDATVQAAGNITIAAERFASVDPNGLLVRFACPTTVDQLVGSGLVFTSLGAVTFSSGVHTFSGTISDGPKMNGQPITLSNATIAGAAFEIGTRLLGSGTIGPLNASGHIELSNGALPIGAIATGNLTLGIAGMPEETGDFHVDLSASGNDVLTVNGSVTINFKPLTVNLLNGYVPPNGRSWVIIDNDGTDPVSGTFNLRSSVLTFGVPLSEGATFISDGQTFRISYVGGTGNDVTLTAVQPLIATSTTLNVSTETPQVGEPVTLTSTVSSSSGTPSGTVSFFDGATLLASVPLASGVASSTHTFAAGTHSITARYDGNTQYESSTSAPRTLTVNRKPTSIGATASVSGSTVTVSASVTAGGSLRPTGSVTVREGAAVLGSAPLDSNGRATLTFALPAGTHELIVTYSGNSDFETSSTTATATVAEPTPALRIVDGVANEDVATIETSVSLSAPSSSPVTVHYVTTDGTAEAGRDYEATSGILVFAPGETTKRIIVTVYDDAEPEDDEWFEIHLSDPAGATLRDRIARLTIVNDDATFHIARDLQYASVGGIALRLDLLTPLIGAGPYPLVIVIDASSWLNPRQHSRIADFLPQDGFAVATIEFRSSAVARFPAQLEDVVAAVGWLRANATTLRLDPAKIAIVGSGRAGGHLAALAATTDQPYLGLRAAIVARAATDLSAMIANGCDGASRIPTLLGCVPGQCAAPAESASPVTHVTGGDSPFLILETPTDCGQSALLAETLRAANVPRNVVAVPTDDPVAMWEAPEVRDAVREHLGRWLLMETVGRRRAVRK